MKAFIALVVVTAAASPARAGSAQVSSIVQQEFTISYARASGEAATATVAKPASGLGYTSITVEDGGSTKITVADDSGATVATGVVADNGNYLIMPKGNGFTLERAGVLASDTSVYPGVVIVNALPDKYELDLFGHFGKIGLKKVKLAKAFDAKQAIKIPAGDDRFKVMIHLPDGTTEESYGMADLGRFHVIHLTYDGKVTVSSLGYIEAAKKRHK